MKRLTQILLLATIVLILMSVRNLAWIRWIEFGVENKASGGEPVQVAAIMKASSVETTEQAGNQEAPEPTRKAEQEAANQAPSEAGSVGPTEQVAAIMKASSVETTEQAGNQEAPEPTRKAEQEAATKQAAHAELAAAAAKETNKLVAASRSGTSRGCKCAAGHGSYYCDMDNSGDIAGGCEDGCEQKPGGHLGHGICVSTEKPVQVKPLATGCSDDVCQAFGLVDGLMAWVSQFDVNQNALLCSDEVKKMPEGVSAFIPRFNRLRQASDGKFCLRFNMIEAALFKLPLSDLRAASKSFSTAKPLNVNEAQAYKFQGIPDYSRKSQWPYVSQEGLEAAATFVYHGPDALVSQVWTPADVMPGDIISVRGPGVSESFWSQVHPHIANPYVLCVQTEAEDVTPGVYASKLQDKTVGVFYTMNRDEKTPKHPKLKPIPIGQLWKTDTTKLYELAVNAPPILDPSRNIGVLIMYSITNSDRITAQEAFRKNFAGTDMLVQPAHVGGSLAVLEMYGRTKFVVSPFGAGPDCHRNWEAIAMGAVPIVLSHNGINELLQSEPVMIVKQWSDVTPALLKSWTPPTIKSKFGWSSYWHGVLEAKSRMLRDQS